MDNCLLLVVLLIGIALFFPFGDQSSHSSPLIGKWHAESQPEKRMEISNSQITIYDEVVSPNRFTPSPMKIRMIYKYKTVGKKLKMGLIKSEVIDPGDPNVHDSTINPKHKEISWEYQVQGDVLTIINQGKALKFRRGARVSQ